MGIRLTIGLLLIAAIVAFSVARDNQALQLRSDNARLAAVIEVPDHAPRPLPAAVLVHGSGRLTASDMLSPAGRRLVGMGLAVLAYDKRGVGSSTGEYASIGPANSVRMFDLLAADALAGVAALRARRDVDASRIGLVGFSQGGWIAPLAASRSPHVAFVVTISGPAVSVGEEIAYSRLAGEDPGSERGLSDEEIDRRLGGFNGPHGYDPITALRSMSAPSLWILGERDRSIPLQKTVAVLTDLATTGRKPITTHVFPGSNHGLRHVVTGEQPDYWRVIASWLRDRGVLKGS